MNEKLGCVARLQRRGNAGHAAARGHASIVAFSFEIYLPRVDAPAETLEPPRPAAAPRGTETVLVVEDDPMVRSLAAKTLRRAGYEVLEAADPDHALELAAAAGDRIALLVTDVVLPRLSGPELADRLRAVRPDLAVLFASGYTDRSGDVEAQLGARTGFLPKPFVPVDLAQVVRTLIDAGDGSADVRGGDPGRAHGGAELGGGSARSP